MTTRINPDCKKELDLVDYEHPSMGRFIFQDEEKNCIFSSIGKSGSSKLRRTTVCHSATPYTIYCGEDTTTAIEILSENGTKIIGLANFDGHGSSAIVSQLCAKIFEKNIVDDSEKLVNAAKLKNGDTLSLILSRWIKEMEEQTHHLRTNAGSTATIGVLINGILTVINLGDSPFIVINKKTKKITVLSMDWGWDNPKAYQKYLDHCKKIGVEPAEAIYGRINCINSIVQLASFNGPIPIYKKGTSEIDILTRDNFLEEIHKRYKKTPHGGSQSKQLFFLERETDDGKWESYCEMEEFGHQNWGSTALHSNGEGGIQMMASIGDYHESKSLNLIKNGNVSIWELPDGEYILATFSDGIKDMDYYHKYHESIIKMSAIKKIGYFLLKKYFNKKCINSKEIGQEIADNIKYHAMSKGKCLMNRPSWDDISVAVANIIIS